MDPLLSPETRSRFALSAAAMLRLPKVCAVVRREVEQTLVEHPELPRTDDTRFVLWGLAFSQVSIGALIERAHSQPERKIV